MKHTLAVILAVLTLGMSVPALAQQSVQAQVAPPTASPVNVSKVYAQVNHQVFWMTCVNFTNTTAKTMRAIEFAFTFVDAFDTPLTTHRADRVGSFAPGVLIEGPDNFTDVGTTGNERKMENCWKVAQVVGSLSKITVQVKKVRYADGTIWEAPVGDTEVFTGTYMTDTTGPDHPDKLKCPMGMVSLVLGWDEWMRRAHENGRSGDLAKSCMGRWYREHQETPPWESAPAPASSSTPH
jgi:hypothetical protein